jgi:hypothetical protein
MYFPLNWEFSSTLSELGISGGEVQTPLWYSTVVVIFEVTYCNITKKFDFGGKN